MYPNISIDHKPPNISQDQKIFFIVITKSKNQKKYLKGRILQYGHNKIWPCKVGDSKTVYGYEASSVVCITDFPLYVLELAGGGHVINYATR